MTSPTVPSPAVSGPQPSADDRSASLTGVWKGRSPAASSDAIWVPAVAGTLVLVAGAMTLATKQPWLFAALGPSALMIASSPGHPTTRFQNVVVGHAIAFVCAWLALLLLGAGSAPALLGAKSIPVVRVWASVLAVAATAFIQPSLRAYHAPAAATALLIAMGTHRPTWKTALAMLAGVVLVAALGEWFQRIRLREQRAGRVSV